MTCERENSSRMHTMSTERRRRYRREEDTKYDDRLVYDQTRKKSYDRMMEDQNVHSIVIVTLKDKRHSLLRRI